MKILHLITRLILGGAQENTVLSVMGQGEAGHEVRLLCGPTTGPEGSLVEEAVASGVDYVEVPLLARAVNPLRDYQAYRQIRRAIREFRPDVVHTHSSKAGIIGRFAAWHEKVPVVVHTIHGLPFHPYQSAALNKLYIWLERVAARRCHKIISVADAMTDQAVAAGVALREKFTTVYSGMLMEPFTDASRDRVAIRARFGFTPDDFVIGKIARLFELKGHDYLLESFAEVRNRYPHAKLLLVGDGLWRVRLEEKASALGIADSTVFAGLIPHDEVPDAICAMDLAVHCSLREGLARVLPQALLSSVPVISFDVDGAREVVIPRKTGYLIPPGDVSALTAAISQVVAEPAPARELAARGREMCLKMFDWRQMSKNLVEIYKHISDNRLT